jgi:hypothetical protein
VKLNLDLLPESARLYVALIGLEPTIALIQHYGGRILWPAKSGEDHDDLVARLGEVAAGKLVAHFREYIRVPACQAAMRAVARDWVRAEFDRLTQEEGLSARKAVARLAGQPPHRYTERYIWTILSSVEAGRVQDVQPGRDTNQMDLF